MYFYRREFVNNLLRLGTRQSYRTIKPTPSGKIRSDVLLTLLNNNRIGIVAPLSEIPADLLTPEEVQEIYGVSKSDLRKWTRRKRKPSPHYRLNKNTFRFPKSLMYEWLKENSI